MVATHKIPKATFEKRGSCISCGSNNFETLWAGSLDAPEVMGRLLESKYSGDLTVLAGSPFRLVRCNDCRVKFHQYHLTDEWLGVLYSDWIDEAQIDAFEKGILAKDKHRKGFELSRQYMKHVLRLSQLINTDGTESPTLLDFGCGDGEFLRLAHLFKFNCFGVDFSASRARRAEAGGVQIYGDLEQLKGVHQGSFQAITIFQTLEHLVEPKQTICEISHLLAAGGILIVDVPDCTSLTVPSTSEEFHKLHPLEHLNCFTPDSLRKLVEKQGFTAIPIPPAHVTTRFSDLIRTEISRFVHPKKTTMYFRKTGQS